LEKRKAMTMGKTRSGNEHHITQSCGVVRDLDRSMREYTERLGWGPWNVYEHKAHILHDTYLRNEPGNFTMIAAETKVGNIGYELIQPVSGDSIYQEFLDRHGEGVQHIAIMKHSPEESEECINDVGATKVMGGKIDDIDFYYLDTADSFGVTVEGVTGHAIDLKPVRVYDGEREE